MARALMMMKLSGPMEATQGSFIRAMAMSHQWATPMWITLRVAEGREGLFAHEEGRDPDEAEYERVGGGDPEQRPSRRLTCGT